MVALDAYVFKYLNTGNIKPEYVFTDAYAKEVHDSEHVCTATKQLRAISYTKYEREYLHKFMKTQCQHLTMTQRNDLLKLLQKFEPFFNGTIGTWKTDPVDFELK